MHGKKLLYVGLSVHWILLLDVVKDKPVRDTH